jgi:hypothetical protein
VLALRKYSRGFSSYGTKVVGSVLRLRVRAGDAHVFGVLHLVQAVDTGLHRHPLQQMGQPARRDGRKLRDGLGGIGELPCCVIAERGGPLTIVDIRRLLVDRRNTGMLIAMGNYRDLKMALNML